MLLVVITPSGSTLEKHLSITLALTHRMPDGIAKRPRINLAPSRNGLRKNDSALPYLESTRESVVIKSPNSSGYGLRTGAPGRRWSVWIRNNSRFQYRPMPRPFDPGSLHPAPAWRLQQEQAAWIARLGANSFIETHPSCRWEATVAHGFDPRAAIARKRRKESYPATATS